MQAIPGYVKVVEKFPEQAEVWLQLARALGYCGRREEAVSIYEQFLTAQPDGEEIRVRYARDLEDWQDYRGALDVWTELLSRGLTKGGAFCGEAAFHRVRLLERLNRVEEARDELGALSKYRTESWGWYWVEGNLLRREGELEKAEERFERAYEMAQGEFRSKCASALARVFDQAGDYAKAYEWMRKTVESRSSEVGAMKRLFPLVDRLPDLPEAESGAGEQELLFLTGFPRSGTTLLAHQLCERYDVGLSEEFDFLKHLVDSAAFGKRRLKPKQLVGRKENLEHLEIYWNAQVESGFVELGGGVPLLDKNPSLGMLTPWLLALEPNAKIIWVDRDARDLWLSSVMLDVPVNGASCWWQNPVDYAEWAGKVFEMSQLLEASLPEDQFVRVSYRELVSDPETILKRIGDRFGFAERARNRERSVATSPSYAEVTKPISLERLNRWKAYRDLMEGEELEAFDALGEIF